MTGTQQRTCSGSCKNTTTTSHLSISIPECKKTCSCSSSSSSSSSFSIKRKRRANFKTWSLSASIYEFQRSILSIPTAQLLRMLFCSVVVWLFCSILFLGRQLEMMHMLTSVFTLTIINPQHRSAFIHTRQTTDILINSNLSVFSAIAMDARTIKVTAIRVFANESTNLTRSMFDTCLLTDLSGQVRRFGKYSLVKVSCDRMNTYLGTCKLFTGFDFKPYALEETEYHQFSYDGFDYSTTAKDKSYENRVTSQLMLKIGRNASKTTLDTRGTFHSTATLTLDYSLNYIRRMDDKKRVKLHIHDPSPAQQLQPRDHGDHIDDGLHHHHRLNRSAASSSSHKTRKQKYLFNFGVVTHSWIHTNESLPSTIYFVRWINHYLMLGAEVIWVYDTTSRVKDQLDLAYAHGNLERGDYGKSIFVIDASQYYDRLKSRSGLNFYYEQCMVIIDAFIRNQHVTRWLSYVDIDEYIFPGFDRRITLGNLASGLNKWVSQYSEDYYYEIQSYLYKYEMCFLPPHVRKSFSMAKEVASNTFALKYMIVRSCATNCEFPDDEERCYGWRGRRKYIFQPSKVTHRRVGIWIHEVRGQPRMVVPKEEAYIKHFRHVMKHNDYFCSYVMLPDGEANQFVAKLNEDLRDGEKLCVDTESSRFK